MPRHHSTPDNAGIDAILRDKMEEILELVEAMAVDASDCDVKLATLVENESELVRIAIVEKLREMLEERAEEKTKELDKYLEAQKRQEVERQQGIFMRWLAWIMSEETLRKIREVFAMRPSVESQVKNIGQELAAKGVLTQMELHNKRELGGLSTNVAKQQGQGKGTDKGRG